MQYQSYQMASHFEEEADNYGADGNRGGVGSLYASSRKQFVKKVYSILMIQLLVTMGFVCLNVFNTSFQQFQYQNIQWFWICFIISLSTLLALFCSPTLCKNYPTNMVLLGVFTLSQSYLVSTICGFYEPISILQAAVATAGATSGLTYYAWTTKYDFTEWVHYFYGFAWCFLMIIVWITFLNFFILTGNYMFMTIYAAIFAVIYSIYILIDTQLILGGKNVALSLDNYVLGAVLLYIDIVGLFLQLLRLFGQRR